MTDLQDVKSKYCDNCINNNRCYTPCPLVNAAILDLPCEREIYNLCKKDGEQE